MKTPETDNRVVDYLYDDLPDTQHEALSAVFESDKAAAIEASSFATILKIYREESAELTPSVAATERLLQEAERAHRSLWARLLGDLLPRVVLRPVVGFAMVAVLLISGGVFYMLSQKPGPDRRTEGAQHASLSETTVSKDAPASTPRPETFSQTASKTGMEGETGKRDKDKSLAEAAPDQDRRDSRAGAQSITAGDRFLYRNGKQGAQAKRLGRRLALERKGLGGLRGRKRVSTKARKKRVYFSVSSVNKAALSGAPQPAPVSANQATEALRAIQKKPAANKESLKDSRDRKLTPPALHNRARKNLAKGQVAVACRMFGSLVRGHRGYSRRADAILGWARCEMARGSYSRAAQLVRKLISEFPKWKKTGAKMQAEIKRQQAQAALRAQRVRRLRRKPAPRRSRPARSSPSRRSKTPY